MKDEQVRDARLKHRDYVICWNCPCELGRLVLVWGGGTMFAAPWFYRKVGDMAGATVLSIRPKVADRLRRNDMPMGDKAHLDSAGRMKVKDPVNYEMPVLLPCWRPGCGRANRVDMAITQP